MYVAPALSFKKADDEYCNDTRTVSRIYGDDCGLLYFKSSWTFRRLHGSSGIQFYIAKGFFDTIPKTIDEAAMLDGATKWQVFTKITIPLSKPIIVYTVLTTFIAPWVDFIFARVICRANADYYTVAIGLWQMLEKEYVDSWYTCFAAGAVCISIPIAVLFIFMQKCYNESMSGAVKG